jgi:hypothetical protein
VQRQQSIGRITVDSIQTFAPKQFIQMLAQGDQRATGSASVQDIGDHTATHNQRYLRRVTFVVLLSLRSLTVERMRVSAERAAEVKVDVSHQKPDSIARR